MQEHEGWVVRNAPRLPGARLLIGYPPGTLVVTSPDNTWVVSAGQQYWENDPSLSNDGNVIATAYVEGRDQVRANAYGYTQLIRPISIATYSLREKTWTRYVRFEEEFKGGIAIAPDASKLAFAVAKWDGRNNPLSQTMHVIDLKSGQERLYPIQGRHEPIALSWSPDGGRIVYDTMPKRAYEGATEYSPEIRILDLEAGESRKVAIGNAPAWSPSGEWIAYYYSPDAVQIESWMHLSSPPSPTQVRLIKPDGTGSMPLTKGRHFAAPPVWSPDSKTVLLSIGTNMMKGTYDVKLVDITTRKVSRIAKDAPPVFGWAEAK